MILLHCSWPHKNLKLSLSRKVIQDGSLNTLFSKRYGAFDSTCISYTEGSAFVGEIIWLGDQAIFPAQGYKSKQSGDSKLLGWLKPYYSESHITFEAFSLNMHVIVRSSLQKLQMLTASANQTRICMSNAKTMTFLFSRLNARSQLFSVTTS